MAVNVTLAGVANVIIGVVVNVTLAGVANVNAGEMVSVSENALAENGMGVVRLTIEDDYSKYGSIVRVTNVYVVSPGGVCRQRCSLVTHSTDIWFWLR